MAKLTVGKGLDEYLSQLENLEFESEDIIGKAIFQGAAIVADQTKANIQALPVVGSTSDRRNGVTQAEKDGLIEGLGIAVMKNDNGYYNVKLGMDGYNSHKTKAYPNGHPNSMVARSLESGTSFMAKIPVFSNAVRSTKSQAEEAMQKAIDEEISKIVK